MVPVTEYKSRIKKCAKSLAAVAKNGIMVVGSSIPPIRSTDQHYPFEQNRDLYYLTGINQLDHAITISTKGTVKIFTAQQTKLEKIWEGERESASSIAKELGVEYHEVPSLHDALFQECRNHGVLLYQSEFHTVGRDLAKRVFEVPPHKRQNLPSALFDSGTITAPLRAIKSPYEVKSIASAIRGTKIGINALLKKLILGGSTEKELATIFQGEITKLGYVMAFDGIVAAGGNAATLHHMPTNRRATSNELVLVDIGASKDYYCGDITRVFPHSGTFEGVLKDAYAAVLSANKLAISKAKAGVLKSTLNEIAARELIYGMKELGLVKGSISSIYKSGKYKEFYPHSLGHSLGLDTHDVGDMRSNPEAVYQNGMVVTIEPGIYLRKKHKHIPAFGIRIEDNIHIGARSSVNLSESIPKEMNDVEKWLHEISLEKEV